MSFIDDMAQLATDVVEGLGGPVNITLKRNVPTTFNAATQVRSESPDVFSITNAIRSASRQQVVSTGSGGFIRVETFSYTVTVADLIAAGWDSTKPIDETWTVTQGSKVYPVVGHDRECGESLVKIIVRTDMGNQM
jgi:hypothetical protein